MSNLGDFSSCVTVSCLFLLFCFCFWGGCFVLFVCGFFMFLFFVCLFFVMISENIHQGIGSNGLEHIQDTLYKLGVHNFWLNQNILNKRFLFILLLNDLDINIYKPGMKF